MTASAIFEGTLTHARRGPTRHRFGYRLHMLYLDLDELEGVQPSGIFRKGRWGWLSFWRADYLGPASVSLKTAVLDLVDARLGVRPAGPVRLLTQVRSLGYVFNPVSFYYCFARDGATLEAVVAEITNTPWKERHAYVLPAAAGEVRAAFPKAFHVSPFFQMTQRYKWVLATPGDTVVVTMVNEEAGRDVFSATLALVRRPWTSRGLMTIALKQPLMAGRVHAAIYWQALRLWWKRTPYVDHPSRGAASKSLESGE